MSEDLDIDSPEARLDMIRIVLRGIIDGSTSPIALAKAGMDLADLTAEQRAELRGEGPAASAASGPGWQWWSGPSDEWYSHGPFATRDEAIAALDGDAGYVTEAHPPAPIRLSAEQLLEDQYFENNDDFDFDHAELDRRGDAEAIAAADAELQVDPTAAMVETNSTIAADCPAAPADSTDGAR